MSEVAHPSRAATITWTVLLGSILALVVFAQLYGERLRQSEVRPLLFANSRLTAEQLGMCLADGMPMTGNAWQPVKDAPGHSIRWNTARDLRAEIIDAAAKGRRVEIATVGGRPLRAPEAAVLRRCLAGG